MIHFVVLHLGKMNMDVVATDREGHRRKVQIMWSNTATPNVPPENWAPLVEHEMAFQLEHELGLESGRVMPSW